MAEEVQNVREGPGLGGHRDGTPALPGLGFHLCPQEGEL